jgi:hypothetical protein
VGHRAPGAQAGRRRLALQATAGEVAAFAALRIDVVGKPRRAFLPAAARGALGAVREPWPITASFPDRAAAATVMDGQFGYVLRARAAGAAEALRYRAARPRLAASGDGPVAAELEDDQGQADVGLWYSPNVSGGWQRPLRGLAAARAAPALDSPGGRLAFVQRESCPAGPCAGLRVGSVASGESAPLDTGFAAWQPDWSPDDAHLAVVTRPGDAAATGPGDLAVVELDTGAVYQLTRGAAFRFPRWSPDGEWLVASGPSGATVIDRWGTVETTPWRGAPTGVDWDDGGTALVVGTQMGVAGLFTPARLLEVPFKPAPPRWPFPPPDLAARVRRAQSAFLTTHPPESALSGYVSPPGIAAARASIENACHDWPTAFGRSTRLYPASCRASVAAFLAEHHAVRVRDTGEDADVQWALAFLEVGLDLAADFIYGPEVLPDSGYRDSFDAVWQNPQRFAGLAISADLLRRAGRLPPELEERTVELASGVARAWQSAWWRPVTCQPPANCRPGMAPTDNEEFVTGTGAAVSLAGHDVAPVVSYTLRWFADHGNSPAEEVAWLGAGALVAAQVTGGRAADAEELAGRARHFTTHAVAMNRYDSLRDVNIRTLNSGRVAGPDGERPYWIENHFSDRPAVPYVGSVWHSLGLAMVASGGPWPALVAPDSWRDLKLATESTLRDAAGALLIDLSPGQRLSFRPEGHPGWVGECGGANRPFTRLGGPDEPDYVSEIGQAAGVDLLATGVALMRVADAAGDAASYRAWDYRLRAALDELIARPPDPSWSRCKTAEFVSANPGYHWTRLLAGYADPYLAASGYTLDSW